MRSKKIAVIAVVLLIVTIGLVRAFGFRPASAEFLIRRNFQISKQQGDARYRTSHPPTGDELTKMSGDRDLCFVDDDCRTDPNFLVDCNVRPHNKYHESEVTTYGGCMVDRYLVCQSSKCTAQQIKTFFR